MRTPRPAAPLPSTGDTVAPAAPKCNAPHRREGARAGGSGPCPAGRRGKAFACKETRSSCKFAPGPGHSRRAQTAVGESTMSTAREAHGSGREAVPGAPSPGGAREKWVIPYVDQPLPFWEAIAEAHGDRIREVYFPLPGNLISSGEPTQPDGHLREFLASGLFP